MIYVIAEDDVEAVKIGSTSSSKALKKRLIKLNEGNPRQLRVIALTDGDRTTEKHLHHVFKRERIRGEWFSRTGAVLEFIERFAMTPMDIRSHWPREVVLDAATFKRASHDIIAVVAAERVTRAREREVQKQAEIQQRLEEGRRMHRCTACEMPGHYVSGCTNMVGVVYRPRIPARAPVLPKMRTWTWRGRDRAL